ncbi:peroxiredoxin-1-like isoform X2 [Dreissena polymorpha]|nr:peroxiredoxin-1-like isoform X2 [Dreissena polymorpha]
MRLSLLATHGQQWLLAVQPHGVRSFVSSGKSGEGSNRQSVGLAERATCRMWCMCGTSLSSPAFMQIALTARHAAQSCHTSATMSIGQLQLTKPAPEWSSNAVVNGEFQEISLAQFRGKYLVFFFYPADFTFVCPTEIIAFSDRVEEFRAIGCEVVACSPDSHFSHLAWVNTPRKQGGLGSMNIPILSDKTYDIAKAYGVFKADDGLAFRGLFIIDDKSNLRQITINDLPVGRSVDETLRLVKAFQFTDKHGEVCPANWKPGSDTIVPDVKGSKTYFSKNN